MELKSNVNCRGVLPAKGEAFPQYGTSPQISSAATFFLVFLVVTLNGFLKSLARKVEPGSFQEQLGLLFPRAVLKLQALLSLTPLDERRRTGVL